MWKPGLFNKIVLACAVFGLIFYNAQSAIAADRPVINVKSISTNAINPGETVTWNFEVSVIPSYFKGIYVSLIDTEGVTRNLNSNVAEYFPKYTVEKAQTLEIPVVLNTHENLLPGTYTLAYFCIYQALQDCVVNSKYLGKIGDKTARSMDLTKYSFVVRDSGKWTNPKPLKIVSFTKNKTSYSPGETAKFELNSQGNLRFDSANLNFMGEYKNYGSAYCNKNQNSNCEYKIDSKTGNTIVYFNVPIPEDYPASSIEINSISLVSSYADNTNVDSTVNSSANWVYSYTYYKGYTYIGDQISQEKSDILNLNDYKIMVLDAGGTENRPPTWKSLKWKNAKVAAGSEVTLSLEINGYNRYINYIYLSGIFSENKTYVSLNYVRESNRISPNGSSDVFPLTKSGIYEVTVRIPRDTKPGTYKIANLVVGSTTCSASTLDQLIQLRSSQANICDGLNSWSTQLDFGNINQNTWLGSGESQVLNLEITSPEKPVVPEIQEKTINQNSMDLYYVYNPEIECDFKSDKGSLKTLKIKNGESPDGYEHIIIDNLKPGTEVSIVSQCTGSDGMQSDTKVIKVYSSKPIAPAAPKLTLVESSLDSASIEFFYREGFKYQVKTNTGQANLSNGKIEIVGLKPATQVSVVIGITDAYEQQTLSEPFIFTTKTPAPPNSPVFELVSKTQNQIVMKFNFDSNYEYTFESESGLVTVLNNRITISKLLPGEKFVLSGYVKDPFKQEVFFRETLQSELPTPPRMPLIILKSITASEITLSISRSDKVKLLLESSAGLITYDGSFVKISNLNPKSIINVTASLIDEFGQNSEKTTRTFTTSSTVNKKSITCIKGKTVKIVSSVNPVCPTGYIKK